MRGILVGVADGWGRESLRSELLEAAVLSAGDPTIAGRAVLGTRAVPPPLIVTSLRLDCAESRLLSELSTDAFGLTVLLNVAEEGGGIIIA